MSKQLLDFKNFKKVSSDKHSTVLKHPDGHEIRVAHAALSPRHKSMLASLPSIEKAPEKMADGGEVADKAEPSMLEALQNKLAQAKQHFEETQAEYLKHQRQLFGMGNEAPVSDAEKQAIASQMGMNMALGTISSPYSKVPIKTAAERMPEGMKAGYQEASQLFDAAMKQAPKEMIAVEAQAVPASKMSPLQQVQKAMNKAGAKRYADGGDVSEDRPLQIEQVSPQEEAAIMAEQQPTEKPLMIEQVPPQEAASLEPQQALQPMTQEPSVTPSSTGLATEQPKAEMPAPEQKTSEDKLSVNPMAGYQDQLQGLEEQYKAEKDLASLKEKELQKSIEQQQKSFNYLQQASKDFQNEWAKISNEIDKGAIDPERYWQNHSKVASAIGLILAGFNPSSAPNAAAQMLQFQMDQNLKAQLANLNSKHNMIAAAAQKYGSLRSGVEAANIFQQQMLAKQLDLASTKVADPAAKARMLQLSGQLKLQAAPAIMRFNIMQGAMKAQQEGNAGQYLQAMRFVDPAMAKEMEARFVPSGSNPTKGDFATIPIPEKAREEMVSRAALQEEAHKLRMWARQHSGQLYAMNPADVTYGKALAAAVQDAYRRANGQGVFKESEANFVKSIVADDPTAFFNKMRIDPKYKALEDSNLTQLNGVRKGYGLKPLQPEMVLNAQEQQLAELARRMPNSPKAKMFLKSRGLE